MAIKIKAVERKQNVGTYAGQYRYVMSADLYTTLSQKKVIEEAALRAGMPRGAMEACWDAAGEVIKAWATEGHSVAIPGLGNMRFGLRAESVESVDKVKSSLIKARRIIFTPNTDLKQELANTSISITCIDRDGNTVTVTSEDDGTVEENESHSNTSVNTSTTEGSDSGDSGSSTSDSGDSGSDDNGGGDSNDPHANE